MAPLRHPLPTLASQSQAQLSQETENHQYGVLVNTYLHTPSQEALARTQPTQAQVFSDAWLIAQFNGF